MKQLLKVISYLVCLFCELSSSSEAVKGEAVKEWTYAWKHRCTQTAGHCCSLRSEVDFIKMPIKAMVVIQCTRGNKARFRKWTGCFIVSQALSVDCFCVGELLLNIPYCWRHGAVLQFLCACPYSFCAAWVIQYAYREWLWLCFNSMCSRGCKSMFWNRNKVHAVIWRLA